jgi:hypothetical protein
VDSCKKARFHILHRSVGLTPVNTCGKYENERLDISVAIAVLLCLKVLVQVNTGHRQCPHCEIRELPGAFALGTNFLLRKCWMKKLQRKPGKSNITMFTRILFCGNIIIDNVIISSINIFDIDHQKKLLFMHFKKAVKFVMTKAFKYCSAQFRIQSTVTTICFDLLEIIHRMFT